ncbi:MAG: Na/Pi cotransporter family protein [Cypionkella sp.]
MLLLWAVRMVRTGVERSWGAALRDGMRKSRGGVVGMAISGAMLAIVLQSTTAVGVLATGFAASGVLTVGAGVAALLGADLGSALVVKLLSFDMQELIPLLIFVGATLFLKFENRQVRQAGRIALGIAFILVSLRMMGDATEPLKQSEILPQAFVYLQSDPLTAFIVATLLTWALHSSVATLLLLTSFAASGLLSIDAALPMVLGANLGGGLIAVWLTRSVSLPARRIPLGNLILRGVATLCVLGVLQIVPIPMTQLGATPAMQLVNFHVLFNLLRVIFSLPFLGLIDRLTEQLWPTPTDAEQGRRPHHSALDRSTTRRPALALASAQRELVHMGETLQTMLQPIPDMLEAGDMSAIARLREIDDEINQRHTDIKLFIAEVNRGELTPAEARRGLEIAGLSVDFEAIGDIIAKNLLQLAETKSRKRLTFSAAGWSEILNLHARVSSNLEIALNVLVSGDLEGARMLVSEKAVLRRLERESHDRHLARLQNGLAESIETSDIHIEAVRALKEINSLVVKVAYPILNSHGYLLDSRLAAHSDQANKLVV